MATRRITNYAKKLDDALSTLALPTSFTFDIETHNPDPRLYITREYTVEGRTGTWYSAVSLLMDATDRSALHDPSAVLHAAIAKYDVEANTGAFTDAAREAARLSRDLLLAALPTAAAQ